MRSLINASLVGAGLMLLLCGCNSLEHKSVNASYTTAGLGIVSGYGILNFGYVKAEYHSIPTNSVTK